MDEYHKCDFEQKKPTEKDIHCMIPLLYKFKETKEMFSGYFGGATD
jgi:hypothetical protein